MSNMRKSFNQNNNL